MLVCSDLSESYVLHLFPLYSGIDLAMLRFMGEKHANA